MGGKKKEENSSLVLQCFGLGRESSSLGSVERGLSSTLPMQPRYSRRWRDREQGLLEAETEEVHILQQALPGCLEWARRSDKEFKAKEDPEVLLGKHMPGRRQVPKYTCRSQQSGSSCLQVQAL